MNVVLLHTKRHDTSIERAVAAMTRDPSRRWTVAELAREAGLSRAVFARRFHDAVGVAPLQHLTALRMRLAADQLVASPEKIAAVAVQVGYTSEFAFAKAFKRWFGVAPGTYRRSVGANTFRAAA